MSENEYTDIYLENITDPSFTGTIFSSDLEHALNSFHLNMPLHQRTIPTPFSKSYYGIGFLYPNLWNERFSEIVSDLITGGFVNYHLEKMTKSKWNMMQTYFETENVVLNLHHLGFGFQICLILAYLAFVTFLVEIGYHWTKNFCKKCSYGIRKKTKSGKEIKNSYLNKSFQEEPKLKSNSGNNKRLASKTHLLTSKEDEYSSDDSNVSNKSMLTKAFGKKVRNSSKGSAQARC